MLPFHPSWSLVRITRTTHLRFIAGKLPTPDVGTRGRQGKYAEYERLILEYLCTSADGGECETPVLLNACRIKKQSTTDVLGRLEKTGLVQRRHSFKNRKRVLVTQAGREKYQSLLAEEAKYPIPIIVRKYLSYRRLEPAGLFPIQQQFIARGLLHNAESVCAFAYPGSGKTLLAEMAIAQTIGEGGKALYCTPYKALDWQKYADFSEWFPHGIGAGVVITDGDNSISQASLAKAQIIIATYERVLGALRRGEEWLSGITLICADEITLLADRERGGAIDILLTLNKIGGSKPRMLTLSTIVGNAPMIARWLHSRLIVENRAHPGVEIQEYLVRPNLGYLNFVSKNGEELTEAYKGRAVEYLILRSLKADQTTLAFVGARAEAQRLAAQLKGLHKHDQELAKRVDAFLKDRYFESTLLTEKLCELLKYGIAFHHAGLHRSIRRFVEDLLRQGLLKTIIATGTLGHGIDYGIDNVIIDYNSITAIHPFESYDYLNYKGRAGRPGKSESTANVYVLCKSERDMETAYSKFFAGASESVVPKNTFEDDTVSTIILTEAMAKSLGIDDICTIVGQTLFGATLGVDRKVVQRLLTVMTSQGLLSNKNGRCSITDFGRRVNSADLSPLDARKILKLGNSPSIQELLSLAANIDLVRRLRGGGARKKDPTPMLLEWIDEKEIDDIRMESINYYDDGDILLFGEYVSIALRKTSVFVSNPKTQRLIENLARRVRYGIREDLADSDLIDIPVLARNKSRNIARQLLANGYRTAADVAKTSAESLAQALSISTEMTSQIIESAGRLATIREV